MVVEVHRQFLLRRYVAPCCSIACFINFLIIAGAFILPLYISWASNSFWIKDALRWEQPELTYKHSLLLTLTGQRIDSRGVSSPMILQWTTSPAANAMIGDSVRAPVVKSRMVDNNRDGKAEELRLSLSVPLQLDETIQAASLLAWADVKLHSATRMQMDSVLVAQANGGGVPGSSVYLDGDLVFVQRDSIPTRPGGVYVPYMASPLSTPEQAKNVADLRIASIVGNYRDRNITVALDVPTPVWSPEIAYTPVSPATVTTADGAYHLMNHRSFDMNVVVRLPPTEIRIRPGAAEELKHGWIQYVSFLVVTIPLAWILRSLIFGYRLLETSVLVDAPRVKSHLE